MAQTYIEEGCSFAFTNGTANAIVAGEVVVSGNLIGVSTGDIAIGDTGIVHKEGIWDLDKTSSLAISQGDKLYYNTSTKKITKTVTDKPIGIAAKGSLSAATTVNVLLYENGSVGTAANVAAIGTANGSDAATTQALANATKTTVNSILTALKAADIMVAD